MNGSLLNRRVIKKVLNTESFFFAKKSDIH